MEVISKKLPLIVDSDISRFWSKVELTSNPDKCWNWLAFKHRGYGKFAVTSSRTPVIATRIAYFITNNIDPFGKAVLHRCDNPSCVNPNHLFLGTNKDNTDDMFKKGRANPPKGTTHWGSKVSEKMVIEIRKKYHNGVTQNELHLKYKIDQAQISRIIHHKAWKHI